MYKYLTPNSKFTVSRHTCHIVFLRVPFCYFSFTQMIFISRLHISLTSVHLFLYSANNSKKLLKCKQTLCSLRTRKCCRYFLDRSVKYNPVVSLNCTHVFIITRCWPKFHILNILSFWIINVLILCILQTSLVCVIYIPEFICLDDFSHLVCRLVKLWSP